MPDEIAAMIGEFIPVARILLGLKRLKIFAFGPRPQDFLACNAPIKPLYDLGVEIMENCELDLYDLFLKAKGDPEIPAVAADMAKELGAGNGYPRLLRQARPVRSGPDPVHGGQPGRLAVRRLRQQVLAGLRKLLRLRALLRQLAAGHARHPGLLRGGHLRRPERIHGHLRHELPATLLDINNTVPYDMFKAAGKTVDGYKPNDLFMGFHCGNTSSTCLINGGLKYQLIMHRLMEPGRSRTSPAARWKGGSSPATSPSSACRATADATLRSYVAEGEVLDIDPQSFGGIGVFAIKEMGRFYRHVLIEKRFPHHTAVAFAPVGKTLFAAAADAGRRGHRLQPPEGNAVQNGKPVRLMNVRTSSRRGAKERK